MRNELAKLGNKLDSIGLFKEANSIDGILRKISFDKKADSTKDWLTRLGVYEFLISLKDIQYNIYFPITITGVKEDNIMLLRRIRAFIIKLSEAKSASTETIFSSWFKNEIGSNFEESLKNWLLNAVLHSHNFLTQGARKIRGLETVKLTPQESEVQINEAINGLIEIERVFGIVFGVTIPSEKSASSLKINPQDIPYEETPETVYNLEPVPSQAKPAPASSVDPWVTYSKKVGDNSMSIKTAWLARAKAKKTDPSYRAYQQWLVQSAKGSGGLSVADVLEQLNAETRRSGMPSARSFTP